MVGPILGGFLATVCSYTYWTVENSWIFELQIRVKCTVWDVLKTSFTFHTCLHMQLGHMSAHSSEVLKCKDSVLTSVDHQSSVHLLIVASADSCRFWATKTNIQQVFSVVFVAIVSFWSKKTFWPQTVENIQCKKNWLKN